MAYFWGRYRDATGREPSIFKSYNGKPTLAVIGSNNLGSAAATGYVGATGVEFGKARFDDWYARCRQVDWDADFLYAYEFGRNFYFYATKLETPQLDLGLEDWSRAFNFTVREPAQFDWWTAQNFTGFRLTETYYDYSEIVQYATDYILDSTANFQSAFVARNFRSTTRGRNSPGFIMEGLICILTEEYGLPFINNFWRRIAERPDVRSAQDVLDNLVVSASFAVGHSLIEVFQSQFKFPISDTAKANLSGLQPKGSLIKLRRGARSSAISGNLLLDPRFGFDETKMPEWYMSQNYFPAIAPKVNGTNPLTGSPALSIVDFTRTAYPDPYYLIFEGRPVTDGSSPRLYKVSAWVKAVDLLMRDGYSNLGAIFSLGLYSNDIGDFGTIFPMASLPPQSSSDPVNFDWIYVERYAARPVVTKGSGSEPVFWIQGQIKSGQLFVSDVNVEQVNLATLDSNLNVINDVENRSAGVGSTVSLSFAVGSLDRVSYQWTKDGAPISGAVSGTYCFPKIKLTDGGIYQCRAFTANGKSITSRAAVVTITGAPVISSSPIGQTSQVGASVRFSISATSTTGTSFQWLKDGRAIPGATGSVLILDNLVRADAGLYTAFISNSAGSTTSSPATLVVNATPLGTVGSSPAITVQPSSQIAFAGSSVTLSAGASGDPIPTFQWFKNNVAIPGATNGTLTFSSALSGNSGSYSVAATNSKGTTISSGATLTVARSNALVNLSMRTNVLEGSSLVAGFVIAGTGSKQVLIRTVGPTLAGFGVRGALPDPTFNVYDSTGKIIASNDNWDKSLASVFTQVGAFPLPEGSRDAAALVVLPAGFSYTVEVLGVNRTSGEVLVEVYELF